jgi:2-methylcitrate dehydratase PrpD
VHAPSAALANGALTHAFELDNLTKPDSGSHPGATLFPSTLAVAQERGYSGRDLVTAFVAGAEVMIRIGRATKHTNEARGFHAPGTTGPFGSAVAVGRLSGFDAPKMTNALGIAGSLAAGLLEFAHSDGAMVKRLHLGRAAEAGVLAASLADEGFTGPSTVLEGEDGFLRVFCTDFDRGELTRGLGEDYVLMTAMIKRFSCHITAHNPVEALLDLKEEHQFSGAEIASIDVAGNERMAKVNNIPAPADVMLAQYSIPFSVALAAYRDPRDPRSFDDAAVHDPDIRSLAQRITMTIVPGQERRDLTATVRVTLKNGQVLLKRVTEFRGTPARPLDQAGLREKFLLLTQQAGREKMNRVFDRLQQIETEKSLDWLVV